MNKVVYFTMADMVHLENASWEPNTATDIVISTIMTTYGLVIEDSSTEKMTIFGQLMRIAYSRYYDYFLSKKIVDTAEFNSFSKWFKCDLDKVSIISFI